MGVRYKSPNTRYCQCSRTHLALDPLEVVDPPELELPELELVEPPDPDDELPDELPAPVETGGHHAPPAHTKPGPGGIP